MKYGERLALAMQRRSDMIGQEISRADVARVAKCAVQNIGMVINDAKGKDQKLNAEAHLAVSAFLRVNPQWLLDETQPVEIPAFVSHPKELSAAAIEMAVLFDLIPTGNKIARARAYNLATAAILESIQGDAAKERKGPG